MTSSLSILKKRSTNSVINKRKIISDKSLLNNKKIDLIFHKGIKSIDLEKYFFSNYFERRDNYYQTLRKDIKGIINNNDSILDTYETKNIYLNKNLINKIKSIMQETYGYCIEPHLLWRLSKIGNHRLQLIISEDYKEKTIIIIDLHHLFLPASDKEHGEKVKDPVKNYNNIKNYKIDIAELF